MYDERLARESDWSKTLPCHGRDNGFESHTSRQNKMTHYLALWTFVPGSALCRSAIHLSILGEIKMGMKSPAHYRAGQHNLKGKKQKLLRCGCCVMFNLRDKERDERQKKEIRNALKCYMDP